VSDGLLYYEDFAPGDHWELPRFTIPAAEIVEFATRWDPQPFHVDPEAAAASHFGGLIASGVHTLTRMVRLQHDAFMDRTANIGGLGLDRVRFPLPARADELLHGEIVVIETSVRENSSRPWGLIVLRHRLLDEQEREVLTFENRVLVKRRPA
jgi:acyl dehydratase